MKDLDRGGNSSSRTEPTKRASALAVTWGEAIQVASGGGHKGPWRMNDSEFHYVDDGSVAVGRGNERAVVWVDNRRKDVFFQMYAPSGQPRFSEEVNVSQSPAVFSWLPRVLVDSDGENVFVLWQEIIFSGGTHGGEIFFARSTNGGRQFDEPLNLSNTIAGAGKGRLTEKRWDNGSLDLARGRDGDLYAAWTEYEGALRFSRSTDGGRSFSDPLQVAGSRTRPARGPTLAVGERGLLHLAWTVGEDPEANIQFTTSSDRGLSFEPAKAISEISSHCDAPSLAVDDKGIAHLVFDASAAGPWGPSHVRYTRRTNGATAFDPPKTISDGSKGGAAFASIAVDGKGNLYVVWEHYDDARGRPKGLMLTTSGDGGTTFGAPSLVPATRGPAGSFNGSLQGLLGDKLDVDSMGSISVVNSLFEPDERSIVRLVPGRLVR